MTGLEIGIFGVQLVATVSVAGGLLYTIRRNGKADLVTDTKFRSEVKGELKNIKEALDHPQDGLKAIKKSVDEQCARCAKISSTLVEQVKSARRDIESNHVDINELKRGKR